MTEATARQIVLAARPHGRPQLTDFRLVETAIPTPSAGQVLLRVQYLCSSKTGRTIHELFFGRLVAENGKIKLLRESVNLVEVALGVFPNGLSDYKAPSELSS